ncbi:TAF-domain-containing protein [Meira miltonrushii]|uniref:TAF-domain-containing protein n=1 Tax=Meira miltonrushii TaxID=1280837 RepID=A0A316VGD9_9BASI|nr:TAF-domain-containing protein [Meira miltonrushii]PWN36384.1 TAF-domain-containing protein [Meira miltonrushii]
MPPRTDTNGSSLPRAQGSSSTSAIYPTDSVQDVAESLSLPPLKDSVASVLALDVEYRIRQIVQDASKFMRHGKRSQLRVADIDRALRQRNIEPIFGFHPTTLGKASASGAYPTPVGSTFRRVKTQTGPIHLVADEEIDLEKVLDTTPKVALSPGVGWSAHWLAVEGVQPAIPQNPVSVTQANGAMTASTSTAGPSMVQPGGASAFLNTPSAGLSGGKPGQPVAKPLIKHVLSRELQLYFERITTSILDPPTDADISESAKRQDAALASLRGDPGLHQLVPYLIQWINEKVQNGLRDEKVLEPMLHTIDALISNIYLGIEPYVHQLLPYVITILITASSGHSPDPSKVYVLRLYAASILARLIQQYSSTYPTLKPRIVRTIVTALDAGPRESAATKLGAIIGLRNLGAGSLRAILVPDGEFAGKEDCLLRRLGDWCSERAQSSPVGKEEVDLIVEELKASFAEVASKMRGAVSISDAADAVQQAEVQTRLGTFWTNAFSQDPESARGVLALLSELQHLKAAQDHS